MARAVTNNAREGNFISVQAQLRRFQESLEELVNDPKLKRRIYLSIMRKKALPVTNAMKAQINSVKQTRLRNGIAARSVSTSHLRKRGATMQEAMMPVIHVGPMRGRGTYMKEGAKTTKQKFAPYWHWVAYGTRERAIKSDKTPRVQMPDGRWVTLVTKKRGAQRANNYADKAYAVVQPTLDQMAGDILKAMERSYDRILKKKGLTKRL